MIILLTGASHTGKTALAQRLLEKYNYPYLSIDHLKMGLIRSGNTELTPMSDTDELTNYLWPIVREMIKTAIENEQNLIVEGCYIPFDWKKDFEDDYLKHIQYYCLVMSEDYIKNHFADICEYANVVEKRLEDDCTVEDLLLDNKQMLELAKKYDANYVLIHDGARPLVTAELINRLITETEQYGACVAGMPVKDTIQMTDERGTITLTPKRDSLWTAQTPQSFLFSLAYDAYEQLMKEQEINVTDDAMVVGLYHEIPIQMVRGSYTNMKVTTPEDLVLAEAFLLHRNVSGE